VVGGHSIASGNVRVIPGTESPPNAQGVYQARIEVPDPANPGRFLPKTNNAGVSTMFPDSWSADRVKVEVDAAYQNRTINGNMWTGTTPSGVVVRGYLNPKTTVYPVY
jgi:filamentous hemagglutinin